MKKTLILTIIFIIFSFFPFYETIAGPTDGLVGHWSFDEIDGVVVPDLSGHENHGFTRIGFTYQSTVAFGDSDASTPMGRTQQNLGPWIVHGLFWVFYGDGSNVVWRTKQVEQGEEGEWSGKQVAVAGKDGGEQVSTAFDGEYFHFVYYINDDNDIAYRRGLPNENGNIVFDEQQVVWTHPTMNAGSNNRMGILVDSNRHVWIQFHAAEGVNNEAIVVSSINTEGGWTDRPGFPVTLDSKDDWFGNIVHPVEIEEGKVLLIWNDSTYQAVLWTADPQDPAAEGTLGSIEDTGLTQGPSNGVRSTALALPTGEAFLNDNVSVVRRNVDGTWTNITPGGMIASDGNGLTSSHNCIRLWEVFDGDNIRYRISCDSGDNWKSSTSLAWTSDSPVVLNPSSFQNAHGQYHGLLWRSGSAPYDIVMGVLGGMDSQQGPQQVDGKIGSALEFDGVRDYVEIPVDSSLDFTDRFTLSVWVYPEQDGQSGHSRIFTRRMLPVSYDSYGLIFDANNHFLSRLQIGKEHADKYSTSVVYPDPLNRWFHVVTVYDGNYLHLYVNGINLASTEVSGDVFLDYTGLIGIGGIAEPDRWFGGLIDDVRAYNRALSTNEIHQLYELGGDVLDPDEKGIIRGGLWGHYNSTVGGAYENMFETAARENITFPGETFTDVLRDRLGFERLEESIVMWRGGIYAPIEGYYRFKFETYLRPRSLSMGVGWGRNIVTTTSLDNPLRWRNHCIGFIDPEEDEIPEDEQLIYLEEGWHSFSIGFRLRAYSRARAYLSWNYAGMGEVTCASSDNWEPIPQHYLSPQSWAADKDVITIPAMNQPRARLDYVITGVYALNPADEPIVEFEIPVEEDKIRKEDVWIVWKGRWDDAAMTVTNLFTNQSVDLVGQRIESALGVPLPFVYARIPSGIISANDDKFRFKFQANISRSGIAVIMPYEDENQPYGRISIRSSGPVYHGVSQTLTFPLGEEDTERVSPFFIFTDGETRYRYPRVRPNYMMMLSGTGGLPSELSVLKNIGGAEVFIPSGSGEPIPDHHSGFTTTDTWYPVYGREGPEFDIISSKYVKNLADWENPINDATGIYDTDIYISDYGYIPPMDVSGRDWVAFQFYSSNIPGDPDGVIGSGESSYILAGGLFSTRDIVPVEGDAPLAEDLDVVEPNYCLSGPAAFFSWNLEEPHEQSAYRIQLATDSEFTNIVRERHATSSHTETSMTDLSYNTEYYWRLKVWNTEGMESEEWAYGPSFETPLHAWPRINFSWSPLFPSVDEEVGFVDESTCYDVFSDGAPCSPENNNTFFWEFQHGSPSVSTEQNPVTSFILSGAKEVELWVTDSSGYVCPGYKTVGAQMSLPRWREIAPF